MSYDIGGGYDGWKTATPWDDERIYHVTFTCSECEEENEGVEAVGSSRSDEVYVNCSECDSENCVDVGRD